MNCGTSVGLRLNGKFPVHKFQPLLHADKTQPPALNSRFSIKAYARITDAQRKGPGLPAKFHVEASRLAVLHRVVQRLL